MTICKDDFTESAIKSSDPLNYYYFSMLASLNYFSNINSMENLLQFTDLIKTTQISEKTETVKAVLNKKGVNLEYDVIHILMK